MSRSRTVSLANAYSVAGALETLAALGQTLLQQGVASPFLVRLNDRRLKYVTPPYHFRPAHPTTAYAPKCVSHPEGVSSSWEQYH